jgi:hypothetical protein
LQSEPVVVAVPVAVAVAAVAVAVPVAVAAVEPVAITLEVFQGNDYHCYQMEPLPANAIRGMYLHMFNG